MKKLMVALSAVALALGARADGITFPVGECFNDATEVPSTFTTPDESSIVSDAPATFSKRATIGTTDMWRDEDPEKNLAVKTKLDAPTFYNLAEAQTMPASGQAVTPLYFDSLVKFTYCDEDATVPTGSDAKLMVWVKEDETAGTTNLMVTAGFLQKDVAKPGVKNYNCGPLADYGVTGPDDWCRLTIKAKGDITSGGLIPGFVVCVNGAPVTIASLPEGNRDIGEEGSAADSLNAVDSFWHAENHLFPSLVNAAYTISAVGFAGQGAVDDIAFAKAEPTLADGTTTFCADKAVASITWPTDGSLTEVTVGGKTMTLSDGAISVPAGEPVVVDATAAEGWMITNGLGTVTIAADEVNKILTAAIVAMVEIGGETTPCASLEDAIGLIEAATADAKLTLNADAGAIAITAANEINVTIDLAGKTITPGAEDDWGIFVDGAAVTVTDTTTPVGTVNGGTSGSVASTIDATLVAGIFKGETGGVTAVANGVKGDEAAKTTIDLDESTTQQWTKDAEGDLYTVTEKVIVKHSFILMIGEVEYSREQIEEGADIDVPEAPTSGLKGWQTFTQWQYQDGTPFEKTTMGEADITLYAGTKFLDQDADENYLVQTAGDLIKLQAYVADGQDTTGKTFLQTADIVWNGESDGEFMGIGKYVVQEAGDYAFKGTYDGQNHTIENIVFGANGQNKYLGVFAQIAGGTVKNLKVKNASTSITTGEFGGAMVVGHLFGGRIENVTSEGAFGSTEKPMTGTAAGIVCRAQFGEVVNCTNNAALYGIGEKVAGIIGITQHATEGQTVTLTGCANNGNMNKASKYGATTGIYLGGMIAYCEGVLTMTDCSNTGVTTLGDGLSANAVGELIGVAKSTFDCTATGCSGTGNRPAVGSYDTAAKATGLAYGVADNSVVAYTDTLAKDTTFILEKAGLAPSFELQAADDFIAFDETLKSGTYTGITAAGDLTVEPTESGKVKTFTAKAPASPWPTPDPQKDEPEAVAEAMEGAGFSEASAVAIGTRANYTAFQGYCTEKGIIPSEVSAAKDNAVLTFALGAEACSKEITSEDITIEAYDQAAGKLTVKIDGVTAGETIHEDVLAKILTAKGGDELDGLAQKNVTVSGYAPADGEIAVTVAPDESFDNPTAFFYQIELKK